MTQKPSAPAAPAPPEPKKSPRATIPKIVNLSVGSGLEACADRIALFGTGKIGKSTLAAWLPAPFFLDCEAGTRKLPVAYDTELRDDPSWPMLRGKAAAIANSPPAGVRSVVVDTLTVAEELAKEFVIETRRTEKGKAVDSIEGYGWGKGWQFVADEFNGLLADLDRIVSSGLHVCVIIHDVASPVPNPGGEDFIRWEPMLYSGDKKGRGSIRARIKNWADHLIFLGYDIAVEEGKGAGCGTRTLYTQELPTHMAGSRTKQIVLPYTLDNPGAIWAELGIS